MRVPGKKVSMLKNIKQGQIIVVRLKNESARKENIHVEIYKTGTDYYNMFKICDGGLLTIKNGGKRNNNYSLYRRFLFISIVRHDPHAAFRANIPVTAPEYEVYNTRK